MELANRISTNATPKLSLRHAAPWKLWLQRHRTRLQLKELLHNDPELLLRDLGIHADTARAEYQKWFWQR